MKSITCKGKKYLLKLTMDPDSLKEMVNDFSIEMFAEGNDNSLIECNGTFINEDAVNYFGESMSFVADNESFELYKAFDALENNCPCRLKDGKFIKSQAPIQATGFVPYDHYSPRDVQKALHVRKGLTTGSIYIARLFVKPEYRKRGIASLLLQNISSLFFDEKKIIVRYAVIIVQPEDKNDEAMRDIMIKTIEKDNFRESKVPGIYVKWSLYDSCEANAWSHWNEKGNIAMRNNFRHYYFAVHGNATIIK